MNEPAAAPSLVHGPPLAEEPGFGALTLPGFLQEVARRHGPREALALREAGAETRWSYAELYRQAMAVARALVACGVGRGSRVGVMMSNRPQWLSAVFGAGLAGAVAVPLSTFSTATELEALLQQSAVGVLLFEARVASRDVAAMLGALAPGIASAEPGRLACGRLPYLRRLAVWGGTAGGAVEAWDGFLRHGEPIEPALVEAMAAAVHPADPGVLLFSSGSTGRPKGVLSAHRAATIQCWRWRRLYDFGPEVVGWSANGFFWSGNFAIGLGAVLAAGGRIVLQRTFDPAEALDLFLREGVTFPYAWPHQWAQLEAQPGWAQADLSSLRYVDPELNLRAPQPTLPRGWREPRHSYGATETFTITTSRPADAPVEAMQGTHGLPLPGVAVKVVEPLSGRLLPRGESGEIAVKGPTLMLGYLGVPLDDTLDAEGFFRTGDGGYIDGEGRLVFQGRLSDIIKTGGANVSPVEVDAALANIPGVKVCKTVGVPHDTLGEMVVSCVACEAGRDLTEAAVRDALRSRLASYKTPRRVVFVDEAELDFTGSAKVKADAARALALRRLQEVAP